jgi:protein disulfide-isomerase
MQKPGVISGLIAGLIAGLIFFQVALELGDFDVISRDHLEQQQLRLAELEQDNLELTEELFRPRPSLYGMLDENDLPYDGDDDASDEVAAARANALAEKQFLMVTFGANWCQDCRSLHLNLHKKEVAQYTEGLFQFVNVDVGKFNQNRHVADELGVSLSRGIPVAVFFDPQGQVIGTTNEGQLEPARRYSSRQILKFVRDIAERSRIQAPDAVQ